MVSLINNKKLNMLFNKFTVTTTGGSSRRLGGGLAKRYPHFFFSSDLGRSPYFGIWVIQIHFLEGKNIKTRYSVAYMLRHRGTHIRNNNVYLIPICKGVADNFPVGVGWYDEKKNMCVLKLLQHFNIDFHVIIDTSFYVIYKSIQRHEAARNFNRFA